VEFRRSLFRDMVTGIKRIGVETSREHFFSNKEWRNHEDDQMAQAAEAEPSRGPSGRSAIHGAGSPRT
jgi:hypothetical protein